MRKSVLLLIFLLSGCYTLFAQKPTPGYCILNNGDTLVGFIDYPGWTKNPRRISFYTSATSIPVQYETDQLLGFEITGQDRYSKATVKKDTRPATLEELRKVQTTHVFGETVTVLLRQLVAGYSLSLYELAEDRNHYYVRNEKTGEYTELLYQWYINGEGQMADRKIYQDQLKVIALSLELPAQYYNKLDRVDYNEKDLVKLITDFNKGKSGVKYTSARKADKIAVKGFGGAGGAFSKVAFTGSAQPLGNIKYEAVFSPFITAGVEFYSKENRHPILLRFELSYTQYTYRGKGSKKTPASQDMMTAVNIKQRNISPALSVLYQFAKISDRYLYAGLSTQYNFSSYPENIYTERNDIFSSERKDFIRVDKNWISGGVTAGIVLKKRWDIGLNTVLIGGFLDDGVNSMRPLVAVLRAHYRF